MHVPWPTRPPGLDAIRRYITEVARLVSVLLKIPLALCVTIAIASCVVSMLMGRVVGFAQGAVDALCILPGLSSLNVCSSLTISETDPPNVAGIIRADFPQLMTVQNRALDQLLDQSDTGLSLATDVKHAEMALQDLISVVHTSNLTNRFALASTLSEFVMDAKIAGRALQKLSAKIHGAIDMYVSL